MMLLRQMKRPMKPKRRKNGQVTLSNGMRINEVIVKNPQSKDLP